MPESFMTDDSVPAWWRLLGLLNGFWINHLPFYASNEWIMKRLRCSEPTVSNAVKKLEKLKIIVCVRKGRNDRVINPFKIVFDLNQLGSRPKPTLVADPSQLIHNSDSNSDNIIPSETEVSQGKSISFVGGLDSDGFPTEAPTKPASRAKYPNAKKVFALFGKYPKNWEMNKTQLKSAENLVEEKGLEKVEKVIQFFLENKDDTFCPQISSPYDLDSKWRKLFEYKKRKENA